MLESYFFIVVFTLNISFPISILGRMIYFSLSYGHLFGFIKLNLFRKLMPEYYEESLEASSELSYSEAYGLFEGDDKESGSYDIVSSKSKLFRLLNCPFCFTTWISIICSIPISFLVYPMAIFLIPIWNFFYQELHYN